MRVCQISLSNPIFDSNSAKKSNIQSSQALNSIDHQSVVGFEATTPNKNTGRSFLDRFGAYYDRLVEKSQREAELAEEKGETKEPNAWDEAVDCLFERGQ